MTCSFCNKISPGCKSVTTKAQICDECVYLGLIHTEDLTPGSVRCFACKQTGTFVVTSTLLGKTILFRMADEGGVARYAPLVKLIPEVQRPITVTRLDCGICHKQVPGWLLKHNKYLREYFKYVPTTKAS